MLFSYFAKVHFFSFIASFSLIIVIFFIRCIIPSKSTLASRPILNVRQIRFVRVIISNTSLSYFYQSNLNIQRYFVPSCHENIQLTRSKSYLVNRNDAFDTISFVTNKRTNRNKYKRIRLKNLQRIIKQKDASLSDISR